MTRGMIDHIGIGVGDYAKAKAFYAQALAPIGVTQIMEVGPDLNPSGWACGFGRDNKPDLWLGEEGQTTPAVHIALTARSRAEVRAFYDAALAAGARDNGPPTAKKSATDSRGAATALRAPPSSAHHARAA